MSTKVYVVCGVFDGGDCGMAWLYGSYSTKRKANAAIKKARKLNDWQSTEYHIEEITLDAAPKEVRLV